MKTRLYRRALGVLVGLMVPPLLSAFGGESPDAATKHCLWKLEAKTNAAYLFGSLHVLKPEFYPLPWVVEEAYATSRIVMFEVDAEAMDSPAMRMRTLQRSQYESGRTLKDGLSVEAYAKLQLHLEKSMPENTVSESFKPWMIALGLLTHEAQNLGFALEHGVDRYFLRTAKKDAKLIVPLETVDAHMDLFFSLTESENEAFLSQALEQILDLKCRLSQITDAWRCGRVEVFDNINAEAVSKYPELQKKLVADRNRQWVPKIEQQLATGKTVFVIVGIAHLVGEGSVVDLLEKKGFKVKQL